MNMTPRKSSFFAYTLPLLCVLSLVIVGCSSPTISSESDKPATPDGPLTTFDVSPGNALIYLNSWRDGYQYDWSSSPLIMGVEWVLGEPGAQTLVRRLGGTDSVRDSLRMVNGSFLARYRIVSDTIIKVASFTDKEGTVLSTWKERYNTRDGRIQVLSCTLICADPDTLMSMTMGSDTTSLHRISISTYRKVSESQGRDAVDFEGVMFFSPKYGLVQEEHEWVTGRRRGEKGFLTSAIKRVLWILKRT